MFFHRILTTAMEVNVERRRPRTGGKKVYGAQAREIICKVYDFMKMEAQQGPILLKQVQERVSQATGVKIRTLQLMLKQNRENNAAGRSFVTPRKNMRKKQRQKTELDAFDQGVVRRTVNEFHRTHGQRPTLKSLLPVLKEKINFRGATWSLSRVVQKLGFKWKKSCDNRKILIEKPDIRHKRILYLRAIQEYRQNKRPIIYNDESYIHSSHTTSHAWSSGETDGLKKPLSKGNYAIIVHAGGEEGFVNDALLTFKSGQKSGDYHDAMNYKNYEKWLTEKLIPNLPMNSVVVIDNASYHNKQVNPAPTSSTKKADMMSWLKERNINFGEKMLKPELYNLIKLHKDRNKTYKIDAILSEHGHSVLRLPPYHPDLNPIEMMWATIKNYVAKHNVSFKIDDCIQLVNDKVASITKDEWVSRCNHVKKIEADYRAQEPIIDNLCEQFIINLGEDSDDSSDDDYASDDNMDEYDDNNIDDGSDGELSGIETM